MSSSSDEEDTNSLFVSLLILGLGLYLLFRFAYSEYLAFLTMKRAMCKGEKSRSVSILDFMMYRWVILML
jgi:hypothetical protein